MNIPTQAKTGLEWATRPKAASRATFRLIRLLSMIIPIPALSVNLTFGNKTKETKELDKKDEVTKPAAQLQTNLTVDPVMLLMLMAIIFLSSAVLVQAARS